MTRYRARLAYDGSAYQGFQRQARGIPTIQSEVETALQRLFGERISIVGAGRTDTGVHATGQVIAFEAEWSHGDQTLLKAINAHLPDDIALQDIQPQADFHPRFDALSRTYRYTLVEAEVRQPLLCKRAWQMRGPFDLEKLQAAAAQLIGEHDFAAFGQAPQGTNTTRTVFASHWVQNANRITDTDAGRELHYEIQATAFLQHMVRRLVGTLVEVGLGRLTLADFTALWHSRDLARAKRLAPPQGLTLIAVAYPPADHPTHAQQEAASTSAGG